MHLETVRRNMKNRGFDVKIFDTAVEAADYLYENIRGTSVGFGGSCTVDGMGLYERLGENNEVYWHWKNKSLEIRRKATTARVYITSANGAAETGELVNIDGGGNRLSATCFDKDLLVYIIGVNKICPTLEDAIKRARTVAAPLNSQRLKCSTPCSGKPGKCYDCASPQRLCRAMMITMEKLETIEKLEVIIVKEELGF